MNRNERIRRRELARGKNLGVPTSASAPKIDYPVFCFRHLVPGYTLSDCNKEQKAHLVDKLGNMAQQDWQRLMVGNYQHGAGFELLPKSGMQAQLPAIVTEDITKLLVMRFNSMSHRIIGFRSDHIFHITHVDVGLTAYQH